MIEDQIFNFQLDKDILEKSKNYCVIKTEDIENSLNINSLRSKVELLFEEKFNTKCCYCLLGISENGEEQGIVSADESKTFKVIEQLCNELGARFTILNEKAGSQGKVYELLIEKPIFTEKPEIKIGLFGEGSSGKSTLIGVLVNGMLDDGNGSARSNIFRYQHELYSGKTSNFSQYVSYFLLL